MASTGLRVNAITLRWDETLADGDRPAEQALIEQAIARAQASGVAVELDIYPLHSQAFTERRRAARRRRTRRRAATRRASSSSRRGPRRVARTFPSVREFVVMNECNQPLFVNPQWDTSGQNQSAAICGRALAAAYDALKGVNGGIHVWGVGLSPRGNDRPTAATNSSTTPVTFLGALGKWFRAYVEEDGPHGAADGRASTSTRTRCRSRCRSRQGYADRALGERLEPVADLPGLLRTRSTARRSGRSASRRAAACRSASTRRASRRTRSARRGYTGSEISATSAGGVVDQYATESYQATWYRQMLDLVACDPNVAIVNIFHLIDETNLCGLAERALLRRPDAEAFGAGRSRLDREDRRALPGKGGPVDGRRR